MKFKAESQEPLIKMHVTVTEHPDPADFERHCHGMYELIYVIQGEGSYMVEGTEYPLKPHTVMLLLPFEYHYVYLEPDSPYERCVINFASDAPFDAVKTLNRFEGNGTASRYYAGENVSDTVRGVFASMDVLRTFYKEDGVWLNGAGRALMRSMLTQLLILLSTEHAQDSDAFEETLLSRVLLYLNENLGEDISLDDLSRRFFVSKYHLCRAFRQYTGTTFLSYLTTKRILLAERLIGEGEPATQVAYRVGFGDYSSFYRAYRKQMGHAPRR